MDRVDIYILRITPLPLLEEAFALVMNDPEVSTCMIEPDSLQLRFLAPAKPAKSLIERIYLAGGLAWSSRHELSTDPPRI